MDVIKWVTLTCFLCSCVAQFEYKTYQFGTPQEEINWGGITVDKDNNIYVGGSSEGAIYDDTNAINQTFIGKYTPDFKLVSHTYWSSRNYSYPVMLAYHENSNTIFACGSVGDFIQEDGFILALDPDTLLIKWEQKVGGDQSDAFWGMSFDPSDPSVIFAVGPSFSSEILNVTITGLGDCLIVKFDVQSGDVLMVMRLGAPGAYTELYSLVLDSEGFIYAPKRVAIGVSIDVEVSKLTPQGGFVWNMTIQSEGDDLAWNIVELDGTLYGSVTSNGYFNTDCSPVNNGTSFGAGVLIYAMETTSGTPQWCQNFRPTSDEDMGYWLGIYLHEDREQLYVVGSSAADLMGASLNGPTSTFDVATLLLDTDGNLVAVDLYGSANSDNPIGGYFQQDACALYVVGVTDGDFAADNLGPRDLFVAEISLPSSHKEKNNDAAIIAGSVVGGVLLIAGVIGAVFFVKQHRTKQGSHSTEPMTASVDLQSPTESHYTPVGSEYQVTSADQTGSEVRPRHDLSGFNNDWIIDYEELQLGNKIGKGSFGVVYLAKWRGSDVAGCGNVIQLMLLVKQLIIEEEEVGKMDVKITDFFAEAELMKKLRPHPNITRLLAVCSLPMCMVFEYVPNGSLASWLHSNKPLESSKKLDIIKGIAAGMLHLHSEGVIHRDLAARNILLDLNLNPKVSDFGMSRLALDNKTNKTEADVGPVKWMAPEALTNRIYNTKTDVWSFGVVVFEILSREFPLKDYHVMEAATNIALGTLSVLPDLDRYMTEHSDDEKVMLMGEIGKMCLVFEPGKRLEFPSIVDRLEGNTVL